MPRPNPEFTGPERNCDFSRAAANDQHGRFRLEAFDDSGTAFPQAALISAVTQALKLPRSSCTQNFNSWPKRLTGMLM
jgi:hypothetical protein